MNRVILKKTDIEYFLFYAIIEIGKAFNLNSSDKLFRTFSVIAGIFLIAKLIDTHYSFRELIIIAILGLLGIAIYANVNKEGALLTILAIIGIKDVDIKQLIKLTLFIRLFAFIALVSCSILGIIQNISNQYVRADKVLVRYNMGFSHPNQFHLAFIIILLLVVYVYYERLTLAHAITFGVLNILIYYRSYSRTSLLIGFIVIFLMLWFKSRYFIKLKNIFCISTIFLSFSMTILAAYFYNRIPNIRFLDRLLQWRLTYNKYYVASYPLNMFGNNLRGDSKTLDCSYIEMLVNYGLAFTIIYFISLIVIVTRYIKKGKYAELILIVCFSVYGITEAFMPNLFDNLSLLFLSEIIFADRNTVTVPADIKIYIHKKYREELS